MAVIPPNVVPTNLTALLAVNGAELPTVITLVVTVVLVTLVNAKYPQLAVDASNGVVRAASVYKENEFDVSTFA